MNGPAWKVNGQHILKHPSTTAANQAVLSSLATLLFFCGHQGLQQVQDDFFLRGRGHALLNNQKGCKLYQLLDATYRPIYCQMALALGHSDTQWQIIKHEQSESILSFRGRLEELTGKLAECGMVLPPLSLRFKLLSLVCCGPYHDVFTVIQNKVCVLSDPDWDITKLDLDVLTDHLDSLLRRSDYYGDSKKLKKGKYPANSRSSRIGGSGVDDPGEPPG
jgi:hypothetical protein